MASFADGSCEAGLVSDPQIFRYQFRFLDFQPLDFGILGTVQSMLSQAQRSSILQRAFLFASILGFSILT